jgi:hypothetical protein
MNNPNSHTQQKISKTPACIGCSTAIDDLLKVKVSLLLLVVGFTFFITAASAFQSSCHKAHGATQSIANQTNTIMAMTNQEFIDSIVDKEFITPLGGAFKYRIRRTAFTGTYFVEEHFEKTSDGWKRHCNLQITDSKIIAYIFFLEKRVNRTLPRSYFKFTEPQGS